MKKFKYIPLLLISLFCICICGVGVYALSLKSIGISGKLSIIPANANCQIEYGIQINNARQDSAYSTLAPEVRYINSTNSASGDLISVTDTTKNVSLGNLYFSSHGETIEDISLAITIKNKSIYPVIVNFALGDTNTVGVYSDSSLKEAYISSESQTLGYSSTLNKAGGISTYNFYLKLNDPTSDITNNLVLDLDISFSEMTSSNNITTTIPATAVNMVNDTVLEYLETAETVAINEIVTSYNTRLDQCKAFTFEYTYAESINSALFELDTSSTFENAKSFISTTNTFSLQNLLINTTYYYRLTLFASSGEFMYTTGILQTAKTPRILTVDGAYNVRDIGGWQESVNIKQGLLYRGTEIDGLFETKYTATETGLKELKELGLVTDFDLRGSNSESPLTGVNTLTFSTPDYSTAISSTGDVVMKQIFTALAEPTNYPMYLHCTYGCDRTGTICYLLEALLGASDTELMIDYELSTLFMSGRVRTQSYVVQFLEDIQTFSGDTTQEKIATYLLSIGITETQIQSIKDIFLA